MSYCPGLPWNDLLRSSGNCGISLVFCVTYQDHHQGHTDQVDSIQVSRSQTITRLRLLNKGSFTHLRRGVMLIPEGILSTYQSPVYSPTHNPTCLQLPEQDYCHQPRQEDPRIKQSKVNARNKKTPPSYDQWSIMAKSVMHQIWHPKMQNLCSRCPG